ncbi:MAG: 2Fe-2S iron-sulfur cluster binding domain-containing protein [Chloroflexi bacterium]|nr:2Fe-2S iron-sulfur cluster binding domain-containing protein [Chloroflexota bacterium]
MIPVIIDGQSLEVEKETTVLEAAQRLGIDIPTLCHHPALEPYGVCRICTVEVISGDWSRLVTACNYPIRWEMEVRTASEKVLKGRQLLAELLLARCPGSPEVREIAASMGVTEARFELGAEEELCYLCGLCVRMCKELIGQSAISFVGRGGDRQVGPPFFKFSDDCIACGACAFICPTGAIKLEDITDKEPRPLLSEFDMGISKRGNVYIPFPQAVPKIPVIDREHCLHYTLGQCGTCEVFCEADAIVYEQEDEFIDVEVDAVIVATGYDLMDPQIKPEFGYGVYPEVMTGIEFERLSSASGPTMGKILINGKEPKDVVFIKCVGSRDSHTGVPYCSRFCCMYTAKHAHLVRDKIPKANITVFYMDVRAFGKGYEEFYDRVKHEHVRYRRGEPSEIYRRGDKLVVLAEDTMLGKPVEVEADLVVLATAAVPRADAPEVAEQLGLELSPDGFFQEAHAKFRPADTLVEGVFLAGSGQGPKDIPDTVAHAKAAASSALGVLARRQRKVASDE